MGRGQSATTHRALERSVTGPLVSLTVAEGSTVVTVRPPGRLPVDVVVPLVPNAAMARRLTAGFRRLAWVSIDITGPRPLCQVAGTTRRPQRQLLPLAAALALADADVPAVVRLGVPRS